MSELETIKVDRPWLKLDCGLGEGPFFEKDTNSIRFVDIKKKHVHTVSLSEPPTDLDKDGQSPSSLKTIELDIPVSVTSNIAGVDPQERILIGVKSGIAELDRKTGSYKVLAHFGEPSNDRLRGNDGGSDPHGRFWLGSMTDFGFGGCFPEGSLNRFDGKGGKVELLNELTIPNTVGWSPDNKIMYFTHSSAQQIFAFDYDTQSGDVSNQRLFYKHEGTGDPDGFRVDVQGNIWHAVYGESRVLKISPEGKLIGQVTFPTRNITCVQFAGTELIATTAADEDSDDPVSRRFGGSLFRVDVGVQGLDLFEFKM